MDEQTIIYRLDQIDKSMAEIKGLVISNALQDKRLTDIEVIIRDMRKEKEKNKDRWLTPLVSGVMSAIIAFVVAKVGS